MTTIEDGEEAEMIAVLPALIKISDAPVNRIWFYDDHHESEPATTATLPFLYVDHEDVWMHRSPKTVCVIYTPAL